MQNQQQQPHWWQSIGQLGQSLGGIARNQMQKHQVNKALQDDSGVQSGIDQAINTTPPMSAGTAPDVGPYPGASPDMGDGTDMGEPMADGKIVTKPTLAVIGEHQPEAVVPLGYRAGAKVRPSMAMKPAGRNYYGG